MNRGKEPAAAEDFVPTSEKRRSRALLLSYFTVGYNVLEGIASLFAGARAESIALTGFGLDSFIESLSGGVMIWRFSAHPGLTEDEEERREEKAVKLVGYTFFILGSYILFESLKSLTLAEAAKPSLFGIAIAVASLIVMPVLYYFKSSTGKSIGSRSLMADSKQTLACTFLSLALLVGLLLNSLFGFWQADPVVGFIIVVFLFREGREALKEKKLCSC